MGFSTTGVTASALGRTIIPTVPANFLSRSRLFPLFQTHSPGATLVVAPTGYGKTNLVAEWAAQDPRPTFWYSVDSQDAMSEFPNFLLASIRQVMPTFGEGNIDLENSDPILAIRAINLEASKLNQPINFVIDNGRLDNSGIAEFAQIIVDMLANNIHLILIRRLTPETSLARYASLGNLSLITSQDLKFNSDEIIKVARLNAVSIPDKDLLKALEICDGWPAAIQLMSRNIAQGIESTDFSVKATNPLGILALETYNTLHEDNKSKLLRLSLMEEFDLESAKIVLGEDYSEAYIHKLATDGSFVTASSGIARKFKFNQIVFETLSQINERTSPKLREVHGKLATYFEKKDDLSSALEHAFLAGDQNRFNEILRPGIREMAQIGRGDELIRWSKYAGEGSDYGDVRKLIVKALGHMVNLDFDMAEAVATEAAFAVGKNNLDSDQNSRIDLILSYVYFARGDLTKAQETQTRSLRDANPDIKARFQDRIALYRLAAATAFIKDDYVEITRILNEASELLIDPKWSNSAYQVQCIHALKLFGEGNLYQAAEAASIAITQAEQVGYTGVFAPLDVMIVLARCELEFSHLDKSAEIYGKVAELSKRWKLWPWHFLATGSILRIEVVRGKVESTLLEIENQRKFLATFPKPNQLAWMIDMSEAFLKYVLEDYERADQLVERMPKIDMVKQLNFNSEIRKNPKKINAILDRLPTSTPREQLFKWMSEAFALSSQENVALKSLSKAVELGSEIGFHETFVRQNKLYPLFVKIAAQQPTYFLENLVREMSDRIKQMNADTGSLEEKLTNRELEILKHLETGNPISAIAKTLHVSQNTMKTHLRNVYRKLDVDGRHTAVEKARKLLLI